MVMAMMVKAVILRPYVLLAGVSFALSLIAIFQIGEVKVKVCMGVRCVYEHVCMYGLCGIGIMGSIR